MGKPGDNGADGFTRLNSFFSMILFEKYMTNNAKSSEQDMSAGARHQLTRILIINMSWCLGLSLFFVVFLWRFWEKGVFVLGVNSCVFLLGLLALFIRPLYRDDRIKARDMYWIVPLGLIPFSYLLYANPFIKAVSLLVYPVLLALFINYGILKGKEGRRWDFDFVINFISRFFSFLPRIGTAFRYYLDMFSPRVKSGKGSIRRIILGIVLLLLISLTVVIPLLSSADPVFGDKLAFIYDWVKQYIAESVFAKTVFVLVFSILLFSALLAWTREFDYSEKNNAKPVDAIVSGIVLGGILALYLLFLWVQIERLWVGSLPFEFRETETLVKSGFWQLFFLTGLNTLLYFFTYRRTSAPVQRILVAFTVASLFLLVSAGHRMALYVTNYGFSYEKFFSSYTVVYSAILFVWLFISLFRKKRANIFKFMVFLFLWMYALITVMPVEQFIFRTNVALAGRSETRIRLYEMTMLSSDVLGLVKEYKSKGWLEEKTKFLDREKKDITGNTFDWQPWIDKQEKLLSEKRWYEFNF